MKEKTIFLLKAAAVTLLLIPILACMPIVLPASFLIEKMINDEEKKLESKECNSNSNK